MSATLASNGSPTVRRATISKSQTQENSRLEDEKGPAHKVCPSTAVLVYNFYTPCWVDSLPCAAIIYIFFTFTSTSLTSVNFVHIPNDSLFASLLMFLFHRYPLSP
jgi:hypothetical protein